MVEPRTVSAEVTTLGDVELPVVSRPTQLPDGLLLVTLMTIVRSLADGILPSSTVTAVYTAPAVTAVEDVNVSVTSSMRQLDPRVKSVAEVVAFRRWIVTLCVPAPRIATPEGMVRVAVCVYVPGMICTSCPAVATDRALLMVANG
jgi:hypothetical protein